MKFDSKDKNAWIVIIVFAVLIGIFSSIDSGDEYSYEQENNDYKYSNKVFSIISS